MEKKMKKIIFAALTALFLIGCGSDATDTKNVEAKLAVGKNLAGTTLNNQNEKSVTIKPETKVVFFSFAKPTGHLCNEFLETKPAEYLAQHNALYVADVSAAPSLIKSMFILPDLKELPFEILLINDDTLSAEFSKGIDKESVVVVYLDNGVITKITNAASKEQLEKAISAK